MHLDTRPLTRGLRDTVRYISVKVHLSVALLSEAESLHCLAIFKQVINQVT